MYKEILLPFGSKNPCPSGAGFFKRAVFFLFLLIALSSCGYHHGFRSELQPFPEGRGARPDASDPLGTISIPVFVNTTFEPLLEKRITDVFKETFLTRGWEVTDGSGETGWLLTGLVQRFERIPISLQLTGRAQEYRIKVALEYTVVRSGTLPGPKRVIEASAEYIASPEPLLDRAAQDRAIREAGRRLAEQVADLIRMENGRE
ncbi:MAG: LptE family protein [Candidatus Manganitrophaceae bacterium]